MNVLYRGDATQLCGWVETDVGVVALATRLPLLDDSPYAVMPIGPIGSDGALVGKRAEAELSGVLIDFVIPCSPGVGFAIGFDLRAEDKSFRAWRVATDGASLKLETVAMLPMITTIVARSWTATSEGVAVVLVCSTRGKQELVWLTTQHRDPMHVQVTVQPTSEAFSSLSDVDLIAHDDGFRLACVDAYSQVRVAALDAPGAEPRISDVSPRAGAKRELSGVALVKSSRGFVVLWRDFNGKMKRETRDGAVLLQELDGAMRKIGTRRRIVEDKDVVRFDVCRTDSGACLIVAMGTRKDEQRVDAIGLTCADDDVRTLAAVRLRLRRPQVFVPSEKGVVVLSAEENKGDWTIKSELVP